MAMANTGRKTSGSRSRRSRHGLNAEINVTPLVDVMLVLMLVFMISASVLAVGIKIDLPKTSAKSLQIQPDPINITVDKVGKIFLQDEEVTLAELAPRLIALAGDGYDERIYVRGDESGSVGPYLKVMATINAAGFSTIGLVTDPIIE